ncbi:MAG: hypothetical protein AAGP08_09780 [Pseudomonadota bacterium]
MKRSVVLALVVGLAGLSASVSVAKELTRQIQVDDSFNDISIKGAGGFAGGFEARVKVIAPAGVIELCGAIVYTNAQTRDAYRRLLRDTTFTINGTPVLKDMTYFLNAKRANRLATSQANCRSTGVPATGSRMEFKFDYPERAYRL